MLSVFGAPPEPIKKTPVIRELQKYPDQVHSLVCVSAQHRQIPDQVLRLFGIVPNYPSGMFASAPLRAGKAGDLNPKEHKQTPHSGGLASACAAGAYPPGREARLGPGAGAHDHDPAASLLAFYARVKMGHVEAGLRADDNWQSFREEINRRGQGWLPSGSTEAFLFQSRSQG